MSSRNSTIFVEQPSKATRSPVGSLSGGVDFLGYEHKIDRLWPKVATQRGGQFCKWGISKPPTRVAITTVFVPVELVSVANFEAL
jgi:hypothetical protein